jgi:hypothetical protein
VQAPTTVDPQDSDTIRVSASWVRKAAKLVRLETEIRLKESRSWRVGQVVSLILLLPKFFLAPRQTKAEFRRRFEGSLKGPAPDLYAQAESLRREVESFRRPNRIEIPPYQARLPGLEAHREPRLTALCVLDALRSAAWPPTLT